MDESNEENVNVEKGEGVGDLVAVEEEPSIALEGNNHEITDENQGNTEEDAVVSEKEDNAADSDLVENGRCRCFRKRSGRNRIR